MDAAIVTDKHKHVKGIYVWIVLTAIADMC